MSDTITVEVDDGASEWLKWAAAEFPTLRKRALKSVGWMMQQEIKAGIRSGAPGGVRYPALMPAGRRKALEQILGRDARPSYRALGKLVNAVGYQYREGEDAVVAGWLSASAVQIGSMMEGGKRYLVNRKVWAAFHAAGIHLKRTTREVVIPPRPTFGPMFELLRPKVPGHLEEKLWSYMTGNESRGVKRSTRKYVVRVGR